MPRKSRSPVDDLRVHAKDCYDPRDYVLVHKDWLAHLQALASPPSVDAVREDTE